MRYTYLLLFLLSALAGHAQDFDKAKLDQFFTALEANDKAMVSVSIRKDGEVVYEKAIGYADVASRQKANTHTQYRIGSITKVFTTVMIFQLIEEGKLTLDTKLSAYYPNVKNADKISISQLLSHHSGIQNFTNGLAYQTYMTKTKTKAEIVEIIEKQGSDFEPGSKASYSNSGFVLLGFIIEDISKDSYANQLQDRIANKLSLSRTVYGGPISLADNQANSYKPDAVGWAISSITDMSIPHGAGAITSTPNDLSEFLTGLFTGKLISQSSIDKMKEMQDGYGRGLFQMPFYERSAFGHGGNIDAFSSNSGYFGQDGVAVVLTANGLRINLNDIMVGVLSVYFDKAFEIPDYSAKPVTLSVETLKQYEGIYASTAMPLKITLKVVDGALTAQATGQSAFPLTTFADNDFRFAQARIKILFDKSDGQIDTKKFTMTQGGGSFKFTRE